MFALNSLVYYSLPRRFKKLFQQVFFFSVYEIQNKKKNHVWADKEDTKTAGLQSNMTKIMRGKHGQKWHDLHLSFSLFFIQIIQSDLNASHTSQTNILEYLCCPYTHRHSMKSDSACRNMSCHHVLPLKMRKVVYIDTTWCLFFFLLFFFLTAQF